MTAVAVAFIASVALGASSGVLLATGTWAEGVRPRRLVREHKTAVTRIAMLAGVLSLAAAAGAIASAEYLRMALAPTCAATAFLLAIALWLLLVEADEEGDAADPDEPQWWPAFERDFEAWTQRTRVPAGPRV